LIIVNFVVQRTIVDGESMFPTLHNKDNLWVEKISPKLDSFHYGEIVTVNVPLEIRKIYNPEKNPIIKRVIALSGDTVEVKDGKVFVNGVAKVEPYIHDNPTEVTGIPENSKLKVPAGKIYVMGDNRTNSTDSRIIGPVDKKWVVGRAIFRFLPIKYFGFIK
jgi:signal peptidase I